MSHRLNKAAFPFDKPKRPAIGGPFFVVRRFECHWFDGLSETQKPGTGEVLAGCPAGEGLVVAILKWVLEKTGFARVAVRTQCYHCRSRIRACQNGDEQAGERSSPRGIVAEIWRMPWQWRDTVAMAGRTVRVAPALTPVMDKDALSVSDGNYVKTVWHVSMPGNYVAPVLPEATEMRG